MPTVTFIPSVGHVKPQFSKEIVCTILVEAPLILTNATIDLVICKIAYVNPQQKLLSWDERQNLIVWDSEQEQKIEDEESGDGSQKSIL